MTTMPEIPRCGTCRIAPRPRPYRWSPGSPYRHSERECEGCWQGRPQSLALPIGLVAWLREPLRAIAFRRPALAMPGRQSRRPLDARAGLGQPRLVHGQLDPLDRLAPGPAEKPLLRPPTTLRWRAERRYQRGSQPNEHR